MCILSAGSDIAHSYTKRKNVFRLKTYNGSEYLLQADDQMDMQVWIRHISANNNPDLDANGVTNAELIIRKSQELTESGPTLGNNTSPTPAHKITKKLSVIKQKVPQSPSIKRRKTVSGDKLEDTGKPKTWKVVPETGGMFGVPLEDCLPSPNNEIVEARGLEMTGVYGIPGNKAAVTILQEEFNKPFIDASRNKDPEKRMLKLKALIHKLPEHHLETFKHLARHLNRVAQYADVNREVTGSITLWEHCIVIASSSLGLRLFEASGLETSGLEASGLEASGLEASGLEASGLEASELEAKAKASGLEASGLEVSGLEASGLEASGLEASGLEASGLEASGFEASGLETSGLETSGLEASGLEASGLEASGLEASGLEASGFEANDEAAECMSLVSAPSSSNMREEAGMDWFIHPLPLRYIGAGSFTYYH
ncbi:hypothetical protein DPMN_018569 [Dreissena polymorpha]|uniref:PH domain-containing protein n=1 Tax=Dreissena polymorpha TaxID=45954 RepID=A0A9D4NDF3_DREPO|nr:hypothetical protein DPMN_018569 [Dreissena polymorpha]